jgi:tetratricopeptide (TPR) repeat protein
MKMNHQKKIEKYLLGELNENDKAEFEKQIEADELLKAQLALQREIHVQINSRAFVSAQITSARGATEELESELDGSLIHQIQSRAFVDKQIESAKATSKKSKTIKLVRFAMAIAAVFIGFVLIQNFMQNRQMDRLFAANFETYENQMTESGIYRGEYDESENHLINEAVFAYEDENYFEAEKLFKQLAQKYTDNNDFLFYLALSQLQNNKTKESINTFSELYQLNSDYDYYEETRWYLSLAYLKQHKKQKARTILKELVEYEGYYFDHANELLNKL